MANGSSARAVIADAIDDAVHLSDQTGKPCCSAAMRRCSSTHLHPAQIVVFDYPGHESMLRSSSLKIQKPDTVTATSTTILLEFGRVHGTM